MGRTPAAYHGPRSEVCMRRFAQRAMKMARVLVVMHDIVSVPVRPEIVLRSAVRERAAKSDPWAGRHNTVLQTSRGLATPSTLVSIFHPKPACDLTEIRVQGARFMEILYPNCAGGDVHLKTVVVCAVWREQGRRRQATRTFGTTTGELLQLADWLVAHGITHIALESTGVYWKSVYYVLESQLEVWLVNAQHVKKVPGRKTDVSDAEWLAAVMECGLVRASFVPPPNQRELRDLTRQRANLVRDRAQVLNRLQKILEDANVKLAAVVSDINGVSALAMLRQMVAGITDAPTLAGLAR